MSATLCMCLCYVVGCGCWLVVRSFSVVRCANRGSLLSSAILELVTHPYDEANHPTCCQLLVCSTGGAAVVGECVLCGVTVGDVHYLGDDGLQSDVEQV